MEYQIIKMSPILKYKGYMACADGRIFSMKTNKFLKPSYDKQGYTRVGLYLGNNKTKTIKIHRLIAETLIPNPNEYNVVNHINGIKDDNRVENLEWCTQSHNMKNAFRTGLKVITEKQKIRFTEMVSNNKLGKNSSARKVIDTVTNKIYDTVTEASLAVGLKITTLSMMLTGGNPNKTNLKYYDEHERTNKERNL